MDRARASGLGRARAMVNRARARARASGWLSKRNRGNRLKQQEPLIPLSIYIHKNRRMLN